MSKTTWKNLTALHFRFTEHPIAFIILYSTEIQIDVIMKISYKVIFDSLENCKINNCIVSSIIPDNTIYIITLRWVLCIHAIFNKLIKFVPKNTLLYNVLF